MRGAAHVQLCSQSKFNPSSQGWVDCGRYVGIVHALLELPGISYLVSPASTRAVCSFAILELSHCFVCFVFQSRRFRSLLDTQVTASQSVPSLVSTMTLLILTGRPDADVHRRLTFGAQSLVGALALPS